MKVISRIKALIYSIYCVICLILVVIGMKIFKNNMKKVRFIWAKTQKFFLGYKVEIVGEFDLSADMIIMNHQSIVDIIVLEEVYPRNLCWIAKKEINDIPFIGQIIKLPKMIYVDRKNSRDLVRILKEAKERISEKRVLAIFPEGTRRNKGDLKPFQNGAKAIANKLNLKVQPIVLIGAHDIINSHDFLVKSGTIKLIILPFVDRSDPNWLEVTREKMQKIMKEYNEI